MATDIIARGMAANAKKSVTELDNKIESEKWIGTKAEWEAVDKSTIKDGTIVYITDDKTVILYDKAEMEKIAVKVAEDRTAAETAAQTALESAGSVNQLKEDLDKLVTFEKGYFTNKNEDNVFTVENDKYTNGGTVQSFANYHLYQMTADKDFHFKCSEDCTDSSHLWICIFNNSISSGNVVAKYANDGRSGMLPLPSDFVKVNQGQIFTISYYSTSASPTTFSIETDYIIGECKLVDTIGLTLMAKSEVEGMIAEAQKTEKRKYIQYSSTITSTSIEELNIYISTITGYIQYKFIHNVVSEKHTDLWRIDRAYSCDDNLIQIKQLTTDGEWEFAFGLYDRPTGSSHFGSGFIGGKQHGNEVMNSIVFIIDGKVTDITTLTDVTEWKTLEIYENTTMYDSSDNTTPCCEHGTLHAFNDNGVVVKQSVKWLIETKMRTSYLAMFPVAKTVTDTLMVDNTWKRENTIPSSGTGIRYDRAKFAILSKDSEGFIGKFYVTEYPSGLDSIGDYFLCTDNTTDYSGTYNKCYFTITGNSGNCIVNVGDIWKSETHYELLVSN